MAQTQTAVAAWDRRWATDEGRADWLEPEPEVREIVALLKARGGAHGRLTSAAASGGMRCSWRRPALRSRRSTAARSASTRLAKSADARGLALSLREGAADALPFADGSLRFRAVVECHLSRQPGRCRPAARRDMAGAEARRAVPGHDAADPQQQLRARPPRSPPTPLSTTRSRSARTRISIATPPGWSRCSPGFELLSLTQREHKKPGSWHWHIVAERRAG